MNKIINDLSSPLKNYVVNLIELKNNFFFNQNQNMIT